MPSSKEKQKQYYILNRETILERVSLRQKKNAEKISQYGKLWRALNPDKCREQNRKSNYKSNYNLSLEEYNNMFVEQQGRCALCGKHQTELGHILYVDHCHTTGKVRGLLCQGCNLGVGHYEKYKDKLDVFEKYIN